MKTLIVVPRGHVDVPEQTTPPGPWTGIGTPNATSWLKGTNADAIIAKIGFFIVYFTFWFFTSRRISKLVSGDRVSGAPAKIQPHELFSPAERPLKRRVTQSKAVLPALTNAVYGTLVQYL